MKGSRRTSRSSFWPGLTETVGIPGLGRELPTDQREVISLQKLLLQAGNHPQFFETVSEVLMQTADYLSSSLLGSAESTRTPLGSRAS